MMYKALEGAPNGKNRIALAMGHQTIRAKQEEQVGRNQSGEDVHRGACHLTSKTSKWHPWRFFVGMLGKIGVCKSRVRYSMCQYIHAK